MAEGRCPVCKQYQHVSPGSMSSEGLYRHRIREKRDCPDFEECLTVAALEDAVMVPCLGCRKHRRKAPERALVENVAKMGTQVED